MDGGVGKVEKGRKGRGVGERSETEWGVGIWGF